VIIQYASNRLLHLLVAEAARTGDGEKFTLQPVVRFRIVYHPQRHFDGEVLLPAGARQRSRAHVGAVVVAHVASSSYLKEVGARPRAAPKPQREQP
jgi:hypothetical protein